MTAKILKVTSLALVTAMYAVSALSPAGVSAKVASVHGNSTSFTQEGRGAHGSLFIHITVADILHNNPCTPDAIITCVAGE
ncbi:MAG TPA: hypothetical protein VGT98_09990 [Candidatus Elarobacter sp.]|nr:hypothetical protein [Candidatus Elarobacter sp.]HEV2738974.1 hypothetical protein [Candidatus Elarobacter sp.]